MVYFIREIVLKALVFSGFVAELAIIPGGET